MRIETITRKLFQFDELSDEAKEKAREWYRNASQGDFDAFQTEFVIKDAKAIGALMGIEVDKIFYSGFWSQGDGACFEGSYSYKKGSVKAVKAYAPQDKELHRIAEALAEVQKRNGYKLEASVKQRGHYYHSGCTEIDVTKGEEELCGHYESGRYFPEEAEGEVRDALRSFMDWIYKSLESEYEYQNSDEVVDETIRINEYEFTEEGRRA